MRPRGLRSPWIIVSRTYGCEKIQPSRQREAREWAAAEGLYPQPLLPAPYADESDCRHGCNGDCVVYGYASEACDWQCHPELEFDPVRAARFDALMTEMEARNPLP